MAQDSLVPFLPKPIDEQLMEKPFFKTGLMFEVDDVKFENDTNYFTLYLINNSDSTITLSSAYYNNNFRSKFLFMVSMQMMPTNYEPYKTILCLYKDVVSCHDADMKDTLFPNYYITQKIKIACPKCNADNRISVRLSLYDYTNWEYGNSITYYSNGFYVNYDKEIFRKYNQLPYMREAHTEPRAAENESKVYTAYVVKKHAPTHLKVYLAGFLSDTIFEAEISKLSSKLKVYRNGEEESAYKIKGAIVMLVDRKTRGIKHIFGLYTDEIDHEELLRIRQLKKDNEIVFSNIEFEDEIGNIYTAGLCRYTVN